MKANGAPSGFRFDDEATGFNLWHGPQEDAGRVNLVSDYSPADGVTISVIGGGVDRSVVAC